MEILKLPGELIHEILCWAALCRDVRHSVKRTLRLRLVCKAFAEAVYPALFQSHRLDDAIFDCCFGDVQYLESMHGTRDLWHRYLVYRVTGETDPNVGRFVETRELAHALCEKDSSLDYQHVVETLCWLALDNIQRGPCTFREWGAPTCNKLRPNTNILRRLQDDTVHDEGLNLLAAAVRLGLPSLVKQLVAEGHNPTKPNFLFPPATQVAAECGSESMMRLLLERKPKPRRPEPYSVFGAAVGGHLDMMRLVMPPPRPPSTARGTQSTRFTPQLVGRALIATASPAVYEYLTAAWGMGKTAPVPPPRYEHLMSHAERGNLAMVRYLLDQGVEINGADDYYRGSALSRACRRGHAEVVGLLLARGANPNFAEDAQKIGLATHAAAAGGCLSIVRTLLARGARVDGPHRGHEKALVAAFETEHTGLVRLLVGRGAPLERVAPWLVSSMLHLGYESMLDLLRGYGFEPEKDANGEVVRHRWGTTRTNKVA
ncbi:ankyrin repeat-containing domain protein [Apiospora marii]|uniref:Ankyrin repeat-containing domain protein n=1 Tax=Apiospora marii TaxID=335849 RepID=A0ABR1STN7_9PEZI